MNVTMESMATAGHKEHYPPVSVTTPTPHRPCFPAFKGWGSKGSTAALLTRQQQGDDWATLKPRTVIQQQPCFITQFSIYVKEKLRMQGLSVYSKLALKLQSSHLSLPNAGISGVHHHVWLLKLLLVVACMNIHMICGYSHATIRGWFCGVVRLLLPTMRVLWPELSLSGLCV